MCRCVNLLCVGRRRPVRGVSWSVLVVAIAVLGCRTSPPAEFRVGLIGHFEGIDSVQSGEPARRGAAIAVDELNAAGGVVIAGVAHRVVLVDRATSDRPDAAASTARSLVNLDSVDVIVGPQYSNLAVAAGAVAEDAEVPMISPMASAADVTRDRAFVNRLAFVDAEQGRVLARFVRDSLGLRRVAAVHKAAMAYGRDVVRLFAEEFRRSGGDMAVIATFDADDPASRRRAIRRVHEARPEAVLFPTLEGPDTLDLHLLRSLGFTGILLGGDAWDSVMLEHDRAVRGGYFTANWDRRSARPETRAFRARYDQRSPGELPRATAAATYDAVRLLARAAARAGVRSGRPVADALRALGVQDGAFGRARFAGSGDPDRGAVILEMVGDSSRVRAVVDPLEAR